MSQQNEAVVRRMIEDGWNRGNLSVLDECLAPDYAVSGPLDSFRGVKGMKDMITKYRTAFPDCRLDIDEMFSAGDRVVVRFTYTGTHKGNLEGLAPTGRSARGHGITVIRFRDGRAASEDGQWDALGMMQQLGVVTLPGKTHGAGA
jgi:steroid delta-isomerase-like uncharacterized protein